MANQSLKIARKKPAVFIGGLAFSISGSKKANG
jgi:hypothetical protein